ncbi:MAG: choice-of-anchor O protein [Acidimicrobiia bacterium]
MSRKIALVIASVALMLPVMLPIAQAQTPPGNANGGPGLFEAQLLAGQTIDAGIVSIWNSPKKVMVHIETADGWRIAATHIYVGYNTGDDLLPVKKGNPELGKFPYKQEYENPVATHHLTLDLKEDLGFSWGSQYSALGTPTVAVHADLVMLDELGQVIAEEGAWAYKDEVSVEFEGSQWGWTNGYRLAHPRRGHFIDSPVVGLGYRGPTQEGVTADSNHESGGGFLFFPGEVIEFSVGTVVLGSADAAKRVSPLDLFDAEIDDPRVINVARLLQSLDNDHSDGKINIRPIVVGCLDMAKEITLGTADVDFSVTGQVEALIDETIAQCRGNPEAIVLEAVDAVEAQANLEAGLNASNIFRKNVSKTEDLGETKQKLEVMPVYFPGMRSNGEPSLCVDENDDGIYDEGVDQLGVPYEEWRLGGDPLGEECDPRVDGEACEVTLIECREVAKPILTAYMGKVDIYDDQVREDFWSERFSWDMYTAISRDDGTTWKRMNVSRMADMSSFDLETGEPFPGTVGSPYLKVNDNKVLVVWQSKFCQSGNPRYAINTCDNPDTPEVPTVDPVTGELVCEEYCRGNPDQGTEVCEPDYPGDDDYYVTDIWGVRGQQRSVDYDEVDDVAELGIGEIPYSCLWAARGVIATEKELDAGTFASMIVEDDADTNVNQCTADGVPYDCCTGAGVGTEFCADESAAVELGDVVWFKPERLTSGRRDVYLPTVGSARGAGFAIAWQEDPSGLRPGKGKGPGEGWSGAISNHKTDMWYSFISYDDFNIVDENFVPGGPGGGTEADPSGDEGYLDKPGLGRPKALVPFSLPVRVTDNDMVNTHTLKVEPSTDGPAFPDSSGENDPVCFPEVVGGSFVPIDPEEIAADFCGHPDADPATCCDPDNHEGDPNCEDLKGLFGNLSGTKSYAYLARSVDDNGDGVPDYEYYEDRGGTLDLCDLSGANAYMDMLPGTSLHERWFGFTNSAGADKLVCVASDGRMLDGDVFASRPMLQLQPYTKSDGTKSAWALLAYEESKGLGHSLALDAHADTDNPVDGIVGVDVDDKGQEKPIKQDIGKNMMYHSFDFTQPDLVDPGHIVNLPALCGGLYPTYCDDPKTPEVIETDADNPTCTCEASQPIPLYFDYLADVDGDPETPDEWLPDDTKFLQYRTEIARRARFLMQSPGKMGATSTLGAIIYKQGQEGQGRPADAFIRRFVKSNNGNPYQFENLQCSTYLDETFALPACPNGPGLMPSDVGYNCNVWGEASGDRLCGGVFDDPNAGHTRRDHINLTSSNVDLAVDAGPDDDTPDDPTDDRYGTNKVLLWSQGIENLGDESYGLVHEDGTACDVLGGEVCPAMYSNVRSHRGFIRGDQLVVAYAMSPNWAAARNGNDRYNFYVRRSFDGGQTWTTNPAGEGVYVCPEFRTDPNTPDPDGSGNLPPEVFDATCGTYDAVPDGELPPLPTGVAMTNYLDPMGATPEGVPAQFIGAGEFEPARNVSEIKSNKETSADPRMGTTPPTYPLDGRVATLPILRFVEDAYLNNMFFVAWGTADNAKSTGGDSLKTEASPLDLFYTRSDDYGDNYVKIPWVIGGDNSNEGVGETVWRYDFVAKGEPEQQGEAQLRATSDGSKAYVIWHSSIAPEEDPDEIVTRWYPWKLEESFENDLWFRRLIFWPDGVVAP